MISYISLLQYLQNESLPLKSTTTHGSPPKRIIISACECHPLVNDVSNTHVPFSNFLYCPTY